MAIGTDCTGSYKYNNHTIMTVTATIFHELQNSLNNYYFYFFYYYFCLFIEPVEKKQKVESVAQFREIKVEDCQVNSAEKTFLIFLPY